jgi:hypothetical protein
MQARRDFGGAPTQRSSGRNAVDHCCLPHSTSPAGRSIGRDYSSGEAGVRGYHQRCWCGSPPAVMAAGVGSTVLPCFGHLATNDLVEVAGLPGRGFFLIDERKVRLVEFL